jgi:hypothetical protein
VRAVARKVALEVDREGLLAAELRLPSGDRFDPQAYLASALHCSARLARCYADEIRQVDGVAEELQALVRQATALRTSLTVRRELLRQKQFEAADVDVIRESRLAEVARAKARLCSAVLAGEQDGRPGYLAGTQAFQSVTAPPDDLLAMKCSLHLADRHDPEVLSLLRKSQSLLAALDGPKFR